MGTDIKLKDLYNDELAYENISTVAIPKADGGDEVEFYVKRPIINYALLDPPVRELTAATDIYFAANGNDGTLLWQLAAKQFLGVIYAPVEGKTTKPIGYMQIKGNTAGLVTNPIPWNVVVYLYEELSGAVLLEVLSQYTGTTDFTAQAGWGQLMLDADEKVTGYAKIDDPTAVTIGIEQPNDIRNADIFYSLLSEVTQEEQTVSVTQNGEQTIVPTAGKSGIRKVALNVNVPQRELQEKSVTLTQNGTTEVTPDEGYDGMSKLTAVVNVAGGGGGVQPDWNQNDSTAADFIKNRPGAYVKAVAGQILTFDGDTTGKYVSIEDGAVKVSDEIIPEDVLKSGSFTYTIHSSSGDETNTLDGSSLVSTNGIYGFAGTVTIMLVVTAAAATAFDMEPGTYLGCDTENTPPQSYVSQFIIPNSSVVVELPETYTQVKQADWSTYENQAFGNTKGCIKNRIGGFIGYSAEEIQGISISFDGSYEDKEHYTLVPNSGNQSVLVRALDSPLTKTQLLTRRNTKGIKLTYNGVNYTNVGGTVAADFDIGAYVLTAKFTVGDVVETLPGLVSVPFPTMFNNPGETIFIPVGTYWIVQVPSGGGNANYFTGVTFSFAPIKQMPSEFLETDFSGREVSAASVILSSSTSGSTKKFKVTVDDTGALTATEVTN